MDWKVYKYTLYYRIKAFGHYTIWTVYITQWIQNGKKIEWKKIQVRGEI